MPPSSLVPHFGQCLSSAAAAITAVSDFFSIFPLSRTPLESHSFVACVRQQGAENSVAKENRLHYVERTFEGELSVQLFLAADVSERVTAEGDVPVLGPPELAGRDRLERILHPASLFEGDLNWRQVRRPLLVRAGSSPCQHQLAAGGLLHHQLKSGLSAQQGVEVRCRHRSLEERDALRLSTLLSQRQRQFQFHGSVAEVHSRRLYQPGNAVAVDQPLGGEADRPGRGHGVCEGCEHAGQAVPELAVQLSVRAVFTNYPEQHLREYR